MLPDLSPVPGQDDASIRLMSKQFEQFLLDCLLGEKTWSDLMIHGGVPELNIKPLASWRKPGGWANVTVDVDGEAVPLISTLGEGEALLDSATIEFYMRQFRKDPSAFSNGDSLRLAIPAGDDYRLRVVFFSMGGRRDQYAIEARRIDRKPRDFMSLETIPPEFRKSVLESNRGLFLVVGPTSAGKTSTCYSILEYFNANRAWHIYCIEDPIENIIESKKSVVTQTEVGPNSRSYVEAMNGALCKAPQCIYIGEIKDEGTAKTAIEAANTGHLVLATMHVDCCETAVERILELAGDSPAARKSVASTLRGVLGQALLPTINGTARALVCDSLMFDGLAETELQALRGAVADGNINQLRNELTRSDSKSRSMNGALLSLVLAKKVTAEAALDATTRSLDLRSKLKL